MRSQVPFVAQETLTAAQFTWALEVLGVTRYAAPKMLGLSRRHIYRISAGEAEVPQPVRLLLAMYLRYGLPAAVSGL